MANEKQKCPMCSTKLKMINGRMTCKSCGYYIRNDSGESYYSQQQGQAQESYRSTEPYYAHPQEAYQNSAAYYTYTPTQTSTQTKSASTQKKSLSIIKKIIIIYVCLQVGSAVAVLLISAFGFFSDYKETKEEQKEQTQEAEPAKTRPSKENTSRREVPESEFFRQMAEAIWEKDYDKITQKEYASLTELQISQRDKVIYYTINNGDTYTLKYQSSMSQDLADLTVFSGLQWLSIDKKLSAGDLDGLDSLYGIYAENSIEEYFDIISYPENIIELGIEDAFFMWALEGIEAFPNLEYLTVEDCELLENISELAKIPDLRGFYLKDCDRVSDYSVLNQMTELEELNITSSKLNSIDFVRGMPWLSSLYIEDSQISSLDALEDCTQLLSLQLIDNLNVKDYSVVGDLEQLFDLTLEMNYGGTLPSFEKLNQLQVLSIKYAGDLTPLKDAVSVTALRLERCSGWELEALASMQELTTLSIHDFSSAVDSLEVLTRLPKLESLDLEGTSVFGNIEEIFGIPTLRYLYLDDCQVGMDFDKIPTNETLETLSLNDISILYDPTYNNGNKVKLMEHFDMFQHFPNLTDLSMVSTEIDSIEFVDMLPNLQYLDITDNHVISLKPLENLRDFQVVWCRNNVILESVSIYSDIVVVNSDY